MAYIPRSEEEKEYLKNYNPNNWPKPAVTTDMAVFGYSGKKLYLLLIERGNFPFKGCWALPGGFANMDEDVIDTAQRELAEETMLRGLYLEQVSMWGKPGRDPRDRTVTALYLALIDKEKAKVEAGDDAGRARWFQITNYMENRDCSKSGKIVRTKKLILENEDVLSPQIRQTVCYGDSKALQEEILDDSGIAFDHAHCIINAYEKLKERMLIGDTAYGILGRSFTAEKLKDLYDTVFQKNWPLNELTRLKIFEKNSDGNFQFKIC